MPIFDYECPKCGSKKEELVKSYDTQVVCTCGSQMTRTIGASAVIVHGYCYANGYAQPAYGPKK